jgi:hypothetical protein
VPGVNRAAPTATADVQAKRAARGSGEPSPSGKPALGEVLPPAAGSSPTRLGAAAGASRAYDLAELAPGELELLPPRRRAALIRYFQASAEALQQKPQQQQQQHQPNTSPEGSPAPSTQPSVSPP